MSNRKWKRILEIWWRQLRRWRPAALVLVVLLSTACGPRLAPPPPAAPIAVQMVIQQAFGPYGQHVVNQAYAVSKCESGWVVTAGAGRYYQGLFQLGRHIVAIRVYGGNFLDPWQNAQAARDLYVSRGRNWSAWTCQP